MGDVKGAQYKIYMGLCAWVYVTLFENVSYADIHSIFRLAMKDR